MRFISLSLLLPLSLLASDAPGSVSPDQVWNDLMAGNGRFVAGHTKHPHQNAKARAALANSQKPRAIILGCADSRVSPEVIFDQGLGDIFVVRVAGNIPDDKILGSIEYAVEHLGSRLIVVLGHERCGAVSAAVKGGEVEGHIASLVEAIAPAVEASKGQPGDPVENAVRANITRVAGEIRSAAPILDKLAAEGKISVVGARYDLDSGRVERIP